MMRGILILMMVAFFSCTVCSETLEVSGAPLQWMIGDNSPDAFKYQSVEFSDSEVKFIDGRGESIEKRFSDTGLSYVLSKSSNGLKMFVETSLHYPTGYLMDMISLELMHFNLFSDGVESTDLLPGMIVPLVKEGNVFRVVSRMFPIGGSGFSIKEKQIVDLMVQLGCLFSAGGYSLSCGENTFTVTPFFFSGDGEVVDIENDLSDGDSLYYVFSDRVGISLFGSLLPSKG